MYKELNTKKNKNLWEFFVSNWFIYYREGVSDEIVGHRLLSYRINDKITQSKL